MPAAMKVPLRQGGHVIQIIANRALHAIWWSIVRKQHILIRQHPTTDI